MMDADKDGIISKSDLRATFDVMGRVANEKELDEMLNEASGPINFTMLLTLFGNRMSGSADDDEVVINAFKSFDEGGKIDGEKLVPLLTHLSFWYQIRNEPGANIQDDGLLGAVKIAYK